MLLCTRYHPLTCGVSTGKARSRHCRQVVGVRNISVRSVSKNTSELVALRRQLQSELEAAVKQEDYAKAAAVKRRLSDVEQQDPVLALNANLKRAIAEERYQDAARLQLELRQLESKLGEPTSDEELTTESNRVTNGIRVQVKSFYVPAKSSPQLSQFFFGYHVVIRNEGHQVVQLKSRHWVIADAKGRRDEVKGPGVVGEQPILLPGKKFEYTSSCPLRTETGSMEGEYHMSVFNEELGDWGEGFEAKIGKFLLSTNGSGNTK